MLSRRTGLQGPEPSPYDRAMSEDDDGAWGEPVPEGAFEDELPEAGPAPMDGGIGDGLESIGTTAADAVRAAADATLGLPIDVGLLLEVLARLNDQIPYKMGGKPSSLKLTTEQFLAERRVEGVDCSGFVRWLLYRSSGGKVRIRDGTFAQRDDFRAMADAMHRAPVPYSDCGKHDGVLRVAGFVKSQKVKFGHIWVVLDGLTGESHGHGGVDRRPWDTGHLENLATWCYPLARLPTG